MSKTKYIYGASDQKPNDQKLGELIIYIAQQCEGDERFAAIKLNKLLFYSDFTHYLKYGRSITGHDYQKLKNGPAPRRLMPVQRDLCEAGAIAVHDRQYFGLKQKRTFALRDPNLALFTATEIAIVDKMIRENWHLNGAEISGKSHEFDGWQLAEMKETIPYSVALIYKRQPTPDEIAYAKQLEVEFNLA
jgi:hypothetical protein